MRTISIFARLLLLPLVLNAGACEEHAPAGGGASEDKGPADEEDKTPEPISFVARWDPLAGLLPEPNDLVLDESTRTLVEPSARSEAQKLWDDIHRNDGGFSISTTVAIPFSKAPDLSSLENGILFFDIESGENVAFDALWDDTSDVLHLTPAEFLPEGKTFVVALLGGDEGLKSEDGDALLPDEKFSSLLVESEFEAPGSEDLSDEEALAWASLYQDYDPAFGRLKDLEVPRDEVALLWMLSTTASSSVIFEVGRRNAPFPNDLLWSDDHTTIQLPSFSINDEMDAVTGPLLDRVKQSDGFSSTGYIFIELSGTAQAQSALGDEGIRLFRMLDETSFVEVTDLEKGLLPDGLTFWMRPALALEPGSTYVYVVTDTLQTHAGSAYVGEDLSSLLKLSSPLTAAGASTLLQLTPEKASGLEAWRLKLSPFIDHLETLGLSRDALALIAPFTTLDAPQYAMDHRIKLYEEAPSVEVTDIVNETPFERGLWILMPRVETVVSGKMTILDFIDATTRHVATDGPKTNTIDFVLTIPKNASTTQKIPVVIFGHGLITSKDLVYGIADKLADHGYASFSIDLPTHGGRSLCREDAECKDSATCAADGRCVFADGTEGRVLQISSPWESGPDVPITSGKYFFELEDPMGARDSLLQGMVDLFQSVRVVGGADWESATGGYELDGNDISYLGISLGSIYGALLSAVEPGVISFALNAASADIICLLEKSTILEAVLDDFLAQRGVTQGTEGFLKFKALSRWLLDPVDPINYAQHAVRSPLFYSDPASGDAAQMPTKRVIIQMAQGDVMVPNEATQMLSQRSGVPIDVYTPLISNHAFLMDPTSFEGAAARNQIAEFFDDR